MNAILLAVSIAAATTTITTPAGQKLECGAPRPLATDSAQTVRVCEPAKKAK